VEGPELAGHLDRLHAAEPKPVKLVQPTLRERAGTIDSHRRNGHFVALADHR
jgi:hypothetical protein